VAYQAAPDRRRLDLGELEDHGIGHVLLLDRGLAGVELAGLTAVVGECFGADASLFADLLHGQSLRGRAGPHLLR
jgi:hypothetical protein